jgi:hypothetical protein
MVSTYGLGDDIGSMNALRRRVWYAPMIAALCRQAANVACVRAIWPVAPRQHLCYNF